MQIQSQKKQFRICLDMIKQTINKTPENMWNMKIGGHVFWQQLLHTLMGVYFWFRDYEEDFSNFQEPFKDRRYYPEFENDPENILSKEELMEFNDLVLSNVNIYFNNKNDQWLDQPAKLYKKLTNNEVINMQIRHVMYHVGFCSALLKEYGKIEIEWIDYFG